MNEKMFEQIISLIQQGGSAAIIIYTIHVVASLLKYIIGFGALYLAVKAVVAAIRETIKVGD